MATLEDAVYGAAVGDALGVPYEFSGRDSFSVKQKMIGGGAHNQPAGTFSDDTSMILATCDSIREKGTVDIADMASKFKAWAKRGEYAVGGVVFDIGGTVSTALYLNEGQVGERDNGNGSLMRMIPLAFTKATDDEVRAVSAITHAHEISMEACVCYVNVARDLIAGEDLEKSVSRHAPDLPAFSRLDGIWDLPRSDISSGGYVVHTLEASIWCLANTSSYRECVLEAVDLGGDTDTTACVAGGLGGIMYGKEDIPVAWTETLRGRDVIEKCLF